VQRVVIGGRKATTQRPGELAEPIDLEQRREELAAKLGRPASDDDLYSHLMYPKVFEDFDAFVKEYDRVSGLPTPAFFYGLAVGEEISVEIAPGKVLFVKMIGISDPDSEGRRNVFYELNGMPRESLVVDHSDGAEGSRHPGQGKPERPPPGRRPDARHGLRGEHSRSAPR
jgi:pyruvate carboxylase